MKLPKTVKLVLVAIACVAGISVVDALIFELAFGLGLIRMVRHGLPGGPFLCIICMYLICLVSISIVTFASAFFHLVDLKMIRLGVIIYVAWHWLTSMRHYVFVLLRLTKYSSYFFPTVTTISYALVLLVSLISLRSLHAGGRRLREKIKKTA